jgi:hypothetical protein
MGTTTTHRPRIRQAISALIDRAQFAFGQNRFTYRGQRDNWLIYGYPERLKAKDYRASYERDDIARRIVESYPKATWAGGFTVTDDLDPSDVSAFEQEIADLYTRLGVDSAMLRADILAGLGQWSILWIIADGEPNTELTTGPVHALFPVGQTNARIEKSVTDPSDERFGLPEFYSVQTKAGSIRVHWSRVVHFAQDILDSRVEGLPTLKHGWNRLVDLRKILATGSEASFRSMDRGVIFNQAQDAEIDSEEEDDFDDEIDEYYHGLKRYMKTSGLDATVLQSHVPNFGPNAKAIVSILAGAYSIPMRKLLGSERGELASVQDDKNFDANTLERQKLYATPLVRDLTDKMIAIGEVTSPANDTYDVVWNVLGSMTAAERSIIAERIARANQAQAKATGEPILNSDEIRETLYDKEPLDGNSSTATDSDSSQS